MIEAGAIAEVRGELRGRGPATAAGQGVQGVELVRLQVEVDQDPLLDGAQVPGQSIILVTAPSTSASRPGTTGSQRSMCRSTASGVVVTAPAYVGTEIFVDEIFDVELCCGSMTHPLRLRSFRLLFLGRTVSALGDAVVPTALALAVLRATGSTTALALVLGCAMVPRLLLLPLGGVVADRFNARRVALATDLARCAAQLVVGAELLGGTRRSPTSRWPPRSAASPRRSPCPTASPLVAGTVEPDARQRANALMGVTANTSRLPARPWPAC